MLEKFNKRNGFNNKEDNGVTKRHQLSQAYNETNDSETGLDIPTPMHFYSQLGNVLTTINLNALDEVIYNDGYFEQEQETPSLIDQEHNGVDKFSKTW